MEHGISETKTFIPRSLWFWSINLTCWLIVFILMIYGSLLKGEWLLAQSLGSALIVLFGIFYGLLFRFYFHRQRLLLRPMRRLVSIVVSFVIITSILAGVVCLLYYISMAHFFPEITPPVPSALTRNVFLGNLVFLNAVNFAVFLGLWCTFYIVVSLYRNSVEREVTTLRLENSLREAQLNTLTAQLNPHFLFNALNNIRFMIEKGHGDAAEMLTRLSDLLRYALENSALEKVVIEDELEVVENYINLAQIQFNDRLIYSGKVAPETRNLLVPPMIIQMLMENAIKHGVDHIRQGAEIKLRIDHEAAKIVIEVSNSIAPTGASHSEAGLKIGLKNIQQRLKLLYGSEASFNTEKRPDMFLAKLIIPAEQK